MTAPKAFLRIAVGRLQIKLHPGSEHSFLFSVCILGVQHRQGHIQPKLELLGSLAMVSSAAAWTRGQEGTRGPVLLA